VRDNLFGAASRIGQRQRQCPNNSAIVGHKSEKPSGGHPSKFYISLKSFFIDWAGLEEVLYINE